MMVCGVVSWGCFVVGLLLSVPLGLSATRGGGGDGVSVHHAIASFSFPSSSSPPPPPPPAPFSKEEADEMETNSDGREKKEVVEGGGTIGWGAGGAPQIQVEEEEMVNGPHETGTEEERHDGLEGKESVGDTEEMGVGGGGGE